MATNPNSDIEQEQKRKVMLIAMPLMGGAYVLSSLLCTYMVAMDVNFNPILGGTELFGLHIYSPFAYSDWRADPMIASAIPDILNDYKWYRIVILGIAGAIVYFVNQAYKTDISHGSAEFATNKDITLSDLGHYVTKNGGVFEKDEKGRKIVKKSGVVVGRNPYNKEIMLHDGPEHVLLMAPTRSGKGVNTIIPTGLVWKASIFFFDPKGELWAMTSGYRKERLHQKVMKFEPLCIDGSTNRWNPLAEINFRTNEEISDVSTIVSVMVKPDGEKKGGGDPFWDNSASNLLNGVIMHLMYKHYKENLPLPSPTDIMSFLSSPDKNTDELFEDMMTYQHITPDEFLEREHDVVKLDSLGNPCKNPDGSFVYVQKLDGKGNPMVDEQGNPVYEKDRYVNPLRAIYGEYYVRDLKKINDALVTCVDFALKRKKGAEKDKLVEQYPEMLRKEKLNYIFESKAKTISEIRDNIRWAIDVVGVKTDNTVTDSETGKICWAVRDDEDMPFHRLLTHPRVAEQAAVMKNGAEQTRASIMQTAQTALGIYGDPVVQGNMCVSDLCIRDLLDPRQEISCYLVMQVKDIATVKPIARLFINTILNKLIRDMKFEKDTGQKKAKKQRLLLMLDEFPQLGNMQAVELALAICAGYGIKMCIVCQDVNQLNKEYTKDNSIASNCHVHIYFTPNLDTGGATSEAISKTLGKKTIKSVSHSDGGGIGKGSNSISSQARDLMTPDEVARMSTEEEIVFVAGHKPIKGGKIRYYLEPWFTSRILDPPKLSDQVTRIESYGELFKMHEADTLERKKKVAEIVEAKRLRAEQERAAMAADASPAPEEKAEVQEAQVDAVTEPAAKAQADEEKPQQPQAGAEQTAENPEKEQPPETGTEPPQKEEQEKKDEGKEEGSGPDTEAGQESHGSEEAGNTEETKEAPAEGARGEDQKPLDRPRRVPHNRRLPVRPVKNSVAADSPNPSMDNEALESKWLHLSNLYSTIRAYDIRNKDEFDEAMQLYNNRYIRLHKELKRMTTDSQRLATMERHIKGLRNLLRSAAEGSGKPQQEPPQDYKRPEPEKMDEATASIYEAIADSEADSEEGNKESGEETPSLLPGPSVFNKLLDKENKEKAQRKDEADGSDK